MRQIYKAAVVAAGVTLSCASAQANIIFLGEIDLGAQGFGNAPRLLTLQGNGTESAVVNVSNGTIVGGGGIPDAQVTMGNGITNTGGDQVNPFSDNQKFGIPTLGSLNFTQGSDIRLVFNATEPGGDSITINDVTLKIFNGNTLALALDNGTTPIVFANTASGNGNAAFLLGLDAAQQTIVNNTIFNQVGFGNFRIALEATLTGAAGGPESFSVISRVPGPIAGAGLPALMALGGVV